MLLDTTGDEASNKEEEMEETSETFTSDADKNIIEINDTEMEESEDQKGEFSEGRISGNDSYFTPDKDGKEFK